jgi:hypothetical protein
VRILFYPEETIFFDPDKRVAITGIFDMWQRHHQMNGWHVFQRLMALERIIIFLFCAPEGETVAGNRNGEKPRPERYLSAIRMKPEESIGEISP